MEVKLHSEGLYNTDFKLLFTMTKNDYFSGSLDPSIKYKFSFLVSLIAVLKRKEVLIKVSREFILNYHVLNSHRLFD